MSAARRMALSLDLDGSGNGSATTENVSGDLSTIVLVGADLNGSTTIAGASESYLTASTAGTYAPRKQVYGVTGVASYYDGVGSYQVYRRFSLSNEPVTVTVSGGTADGSGVAHIVVV